MSVQAALPSHVWSERGAILTFIVPAPDGCDLACPFCYVTQRGEDRAAVLLTPDDYARFIREVAATEPIAALCIQGFEPLLDASFAYSRAILSTGRWLGVPTSVISNGTHLAERVDELRVLALDRLSVSLDAATAESHDRQRGKVGAFEATVRGLKAAVRVLAPQTELAVTSVLLPKRRAQLDGLPALLKEIGVGHWTVTALQKVGRDAIGGPVGDRKRVLADLAVLQEAADCASIAFAVDDEFDGLGDADVGRSPESLRLNRLVRPEGVYRLAPDGRCSKGGELLRTLSAESAIWQPETHAGAFLSAL